MNLPAEKGGFLEGIRALDLAGPMGMYAGKLMADMGADVIKVEQPGGDPMRNIGPFYHDDPDPEKSLYWFAMNTSKRGITLGLETADGRDIFRRLAKSADVVIESFPPGYMEELGLGYLALRDLNPGIIVTSITGFGQNGPYRDWKSSDLIGVGMGGLMYFAGFPGEPPNRPGASQGYYQASLHGAVGTMLALYHRDLTGEGQWIDISMQEAVSMSMETAMQTWDLRKQVKGRTGDSHALPSLFLFPCKNGYTYWMVGITGHGAQRDVLVEWMASEGMAEDLTDEKWVPLMEKMSDLPGLVTLAATDQVAFMTMAAEFAHFDEVFRKFLMAKTKEELYAEGQKRRLMVVPVNDTSDLIKDPQLIFRKFFVDVHHSELGASITYPGAPYRLSGFEWSIRRRAPRIGEHNIEVYEGELGLSRGQLAVLKQEGAI